MREWSNWEVKRDWAADEILIYSWVTGRSRVSPRDPVRYFDSHHGRLAFPHPHPIFFRFTHFPSPGHLESSESVASQICCYPFPRITASPSSLRMLISSVLYVSYETLNTRYAVHRGLVTPHLVSRIYHHFVNGSCFESEQFRRNYCAIHAIVPSRDFSAAQNSPYSGPSDLPRRIFGGIAMHKGPSYVTHCGDGQHRSSVQNFISWYPRFLKSEEPCRNRSLTFP